MAYITSNQTLINRNRLSLYRDDGSSKTVEHEDSVYIYEEVPIDCDGMDIDIGFEFSKSKDDEQLVSGWANVSVNADGSIPLDWSDDIITPETLEKAAIGFMLDYRESGVMHEGGPVGTVVESIVFTKEKLAILGVPEGCVNLGWFITVKVHDKETFAKVKDGTYKMFSIQGKCNRVKL